MFFGKNNKLSEQVDRLNNILEKSNIEALSYILSNRREIITRNFLAGIFRGIGIGIGVTIITAILLIMLQKIVTLNIPVIGKYIADIVDIVNRTTKY